jgi:trimeric autotransporter adhesin
MKKLLFSCLSILFTSNYLFAQINNCSGALTITVDSACVAGTSQLTGQTLNGATYVAGELGTTTSACTFVASPDVWYKFVARTQYPTVTASNLGTSWGGGGANLKIQLLSGTCGTFSEVACGNNTPVTPATNTPLTPGVTYYIRIHKTTITAPTGPNWGFSICVTDPVTKAGRMNEVFSRTILSPADPSPGALQYPWEITYGPDNNLWVTEARGYKMYKIDPNTGTKTTVLDLSTGSTWLTTNGAPAGSDTLAVINTASWTGGFPLGTAANPPWPQGGFAGMALHPQFLDGSGTNDYAYVAYVHRYLSGGGTTGGILFRNKIVRFTYNTVTQKFSSPVVLCDTLPGSSDHNSQRMIIAPTTPGGTNYLFYGEGDMGAGQFGNRDRVNKAQNAASYEGKILRFNLLSDGDAGAAAWIPNDNPYSATSAVWSTGIRNNQGFAYDTALNILYGTSHGPYSDDELNIIQPSKNYGHPLVIGYASDGNYNGTTTQPLNTSITAGAPFTDNTGISGCPPIGDEAVNAVTIGAAYKDPVFSAYASTAATIQTTWRTNPGNGGWESEAWSGLDLYTNKIIPGWKKSLVGAGLKWGRLIRLKMNLTGNATLPSNIGGTTGNSGDTITYFQSTNRYRDLAFAPNGKDIFLVMDNNSATSGPGTNNPVTPACPGCVIKYSFLGYADVAGKSTIPGSIDVTTAATNFVCNAGTSVTIDNTNNFLWVPITGPDGNIMAEIKANGNNLGLVTSSFYQNAGAIRVRNSNRYLDRNITITPTVQPSSAVNIRLYMTAAEYNALDLDPLSGVSAVTDLKILKNSDACAAAVASNTTLINPTFALAHGTAGYMLQGNVSSFSSFYIGASNITLPLQLIYFTGILKNNATRLNWETENEKDVSSFIVERGIDGHNFSGIGTVAAIGNTTNKSQYAYIDYDVTKQSSPVVYYRLRMVDIDGGFTYSQVVAISLAEITGRVSIFPNPASQKVTVSINTPVSGKVNWKLTDNTGRIVLQNTYLLRQGNNNLQIDISRLSGGVYYLTVSGAGVDQKVKLQKL